MAGFRVEGNTSGNVAEVDTNNNLRVTLPTVAAATGIVRNFSENDPGTATGSVYLKAPETSTDFRLRVGMDTVLFTDTFNASTQNTSLWSYTFATMTASQPGNGYLQLGTVQGTTSAHGCFLRSFQYFPLVGTTAIAVEVTGGVFTSPLVAGEIILQGLGLPGAVNTAPTDGVWFKITNTGVYGEIVYNGVSTATGVFTFTPVTSENAKYVLVIGEAEVEFWINDVLQGELPVPVGNGQPFIQASLPVFMQRYNTGAVSNTAIYRITDVTVSLLDINTSKPWAHQLAGMGQHSSIGQNGHTQGKTSLWTNNTAPTAVALTNTTAAFTGLGGIVAVLPTLTVNSDGKLITYQNPVPSINITGRNLYITRCTIQGAVSVILAGGPVIYALAIAYGHTATSLATTETASFATGTTHAPRVMPMGIQSYATTAAVGTLGGVVDADFAVPLCIRPGEFIDVIARNIGTVTTTGAITFTVSFGGYWE